MKSRVALLRYVHNKYRAHSDLSEISDIKEISVVQNKGEL